MTWLTAALAAAAIMAVVSVVDSHLISRRMPSIWSFLIPAGVSHLVFGLIILAVHPVVEGADAFSWFIAVVSGVARAVAAFLMLYAMRTEEVSRIIPVVYAHPVFVAILAVPLLDESLSLVQWMAILMTVAGVGLISLKGRGREARLRRSFSMLLVSSILFGVANVATKYASESIPFWNMYSVTILTFWAIENGPVSLVSTVIGTRPLFVFLYALALSRFLPGVLDERFGLSTAAAKVVSIALVAGGVALINLVD